MFLFLFIFIICLIIIINILAPLILIHLIPSINTDEQNGNYLLVIAHPDDECLFFSPILLSLHSNTYILCLSNGNNHRSDELHRSCQQLHVKEYRIIDDQIYLRDDQNVSWSSEAILGHVKQAIRRWNISTIISFDQYGVSGHRNHSSIYYALLNLPQTRFLSLQSLPIYRKYLTLFEFIRIYSKPKSNNLKTFILPIKYCLTPHKAMFEHRSQLVWFRYLYLLFSRYIWINDFEQIY
jgi:N-acetylglucosaminylphosphatidylinositol deacetylase